MPQFNQSPELAQGEGIAQVDVGVGGINAVVDVEFFIRAQ